MHKLTSASRASFAKKLGRETTAFIERCNDMSGMLADAADSEKSVPLRKCLRVTAENIDQLVISLNDVLGRSESSSC